MKDKSFKELLMSVKQAGEIRRGERSPSRVFHFSPVKVKAIREKLKLTQVEFANLICISRATLRNWEQGRTYPDGPAIALLRVADLKPAAVLEALHAA